MSSTIAIGILIAVGFVILGLLIKKWLNDLGEKQKTSDDLTEWLKSTSQRLEDQNKNFTQVLNSNTSALNERLDKAAYVISKVQKNIGEMSEIGRGMKDLQEFLRSPKLRGNIGEQVLKELLVQILPKGKFHLQHSFSTGVTVDAAIETANGIICIDAKFPMENFRKMSESSDQKTREKIHRDFINDIRKHLRDISNKYILTNEGTIDYALMYIPSESVYYEVVNEPEIFDYASEKRVLPVSPTTFYAYLKAILASFEGQKIQQQAKEILESLRAIEKGYQIVDNELSVLQKHINNTYNVMARFTKSFSQLGQRIQLTRVLEKQPSPQEIEEEVS